MDIVWKDSACVLQLVWDCEEIISFSLQPGRLEPGDKIPCQIKCYVIAKSFSRYGGEVSCQVWGVFETHKHVPAVLDGSSLQFRFWGRGLALAYVSFKYHASFAQLGGKNSFDPLTRWLNEASASWNLWTKAGKFTKWIHVGCNCLTDSFPSTTPSFHMLLLGKR